MQQVKNHSVQYIARPGPSASRAHFPQAPQHEAMEPLRHLDDAKRRFDRLLPESVANARPTAVRCASFWAKGAAAPGSGGFSRVLRCVMLRPCVSRLIAASTLRPSVFVSTRVIASLTKPLSTNTQIGAPCSRTAENVGASCSLLLAAWHTRAPTIRREVRSAFGSGPRGFSPSARRAARFVVSGLFRR